MRTLLTVVAVLAVSCGVDRQPNAETCTLPDMPNTCECGFQFCTACRCTPGDLECPFTHVGTIVEINCLGFDAGQP